MSHGAGSSSSGGIDSADRVALGAFGVVVRGYSLAARRDAAEQAALRRFLVEHELVLFRDQDLSPDEQAALGHSFGPVEGQEYTKDSPHPDVIVISNLRPDGAIAAKMHDQMRGIAINEQWHTDSSFREMPATFSIFQAVRVPPVGGDTFYASLRLGWERLPQGQRSRLAGLRAIHDYGEAYRRTGFDMSAFAGVELPPVSHPIVRTHPESGRPSLYVSGHATGVEGMEPDAGHTLVAGLVDHCTREQDVVRHRWKPGDVMIWDNRSVLHRAQGFDETHARVMHHVRVAGSERVV